MDLNPGVQWGRVIGITGGMGCGKSHLVDSLHLKAFKQNIKLNSISIDNLRYSMLCGEDSIHYQVRKSLSDALDVSLAEDGAFYFPEISRAILRSKESQQIFREIACPALVDEVREFISYTEGRIMIEGAMLLEEGFGSVLDSPIILVHCDEELQWQRATHGKGFRFSENEVRERLRFQPDFNERMMLARDLGVDVVSVDTTNPDMAAKAFESIFQGFLASTADLSVTEPCAFP